MKQALLVGSAAVAVLVAAFSTTRPHVPSPVRPVVPVLTHTTPAEKKLPAFEIISDEQLFAELRDRPLLILPLEREGRRIVLLQR